MQLARVVGTVVSTRKDEALRGVKLLVVQPLAADGRPQGPAFVATDAIGAGAGEEVFWVRGREAAIPFAPVEVPADATLVGIVDHWNVGTERVAGLDVKRGGRR